MKNVIPDLRVFSEHWAPRTSLLTLYEVLDSQVKNWNLIDSQAAFTQPRPWLLRGVLWQKSTLLPLWHPQNPVLLLVQGTFYHLGCPLCPPSNSKAFNTWLLTAGICPNPFRSQDSENSTQVKKEAQTQRQNIWWSLDREILYAINTYFADGFIEAPPRVTQINNLWIIYPLLLVLL